MADWSIRNLEEIRWGRLPGIGIGTGTRPEQDELWEQLGVAVRLLEPGETLAVYHRENDQEYFLGWGEYPVDELASKHGVGVAEATDDPDVAYARYGEIRRVQYDGWLE